jgi:hypothetical protein
MMVQSKAEAVYLESIEQNVLTEAEALGFELRPQGYVHHYG